MARTLRGARWRPALLAAALAGIAGTAAAETLEDALAKAYLNNPALEASRAELRATDELVPQALAGGRPTVTIDGQGGWVWEDEGSAGGGSDSRFPNALSLRLSQPLYRGGRTEAETEQAENLVRAQRALTTAVEQQVLLDTVIAYMDVVRDLAILELTRNNLQVLLRQLEATQDRFEVGEITRTDVAQAESRVALAVAQRTQAEGNLTASRARYLELVGDLPTDLVPPPPPAILPADAVEAVAGSAANPTVLAAEFTLQAARAQAQAVYGELLPRVTLDGDLTTSENERIGGGRSNSAGVLARVIIPLYQGGGVEARVREAKQVIAQRRQQIEEQRRAAAQAATTAWQALATSRAQIDSFEAQVRAAEIALEGVEQEALVGARTVLDVLDAEQEALDARVNLVVARRDLVVAGYTLLSAVGRLTAQDLALPVPYYPLDAYYEQVRDKRWGSGPPIE